MQWRGHEAKRQRLERLDFSSVMECLTYMKHNERARVAPLHFSFELPFRAQTKTQRVQHVHAPWLGIGFACSLCRPFLGSLAPLVLIPVLAL